MKYLESEVTDHPQPELIPDYRARLDGIEDAVNNKIIDQKDTMRKSIAINGSPRSGGNTGGLYET